jgi:O-antigen ligase
MWRHNVDFFVLIGTTVLFIPFLGLGLAIDPVLMPRFLVWAAVLSILVAMAVIRLCTNNENDYSVLRLGVFPTFTAYFVLSLLSLVKAVNASEGIYEVLRVFLCLVHISIAATLLMRRRDYISTLAKAVALTTVGLSAITMYYYLLIGKIDHCPVMANKNLLSSALFLTLPFCLYGILVLRRLWRAASMFAATMALTSIFLLQTRAVWVGLLTSAVATTVVYGFLHRKWPGSQQGESTFSRGLMCIAAALVIVISVSGYFCWRSDSARAYIDRIRSVCSFKAEANRERLLMWQQSLELVEDNPVLGVGAGNWKITLPSRGLGRLTERSFKRVHFQRPHNDYVWILCETGIVGLVLYLSIFGIVIGYILRIIIRHPDAHDRLVAVLMFFGIVGYMTISFFSFPKERVFHSIFLMLMLAIVVSTYHRAFGGTKTVPRTLVFVLATASLFLLLFAIVFGYIRLTAEMHTKRALVARRAKNWQKVISEIDKGYSVLATLDPTSAPLHWYRGEANFLLNNVPQAFEDYKNAYRAHPYHIHVLNNLATCYELQGDHNQAVRYYKKALGIWPQFQEALINLGATYYNSGRYEQAYQTLLRCKSDEPNPKVQKYLKAVKDKLE